MKKSLLGISLFTVCGLYILLSAIIILIAILTDIPVIYGIITSMIVLIIQFLISPFITDLSMRWFYKASFDIVLPDYLNTFIKEVCEKENMKIPRIGYIDDGAPNAFTYGHTKNDARIVLTRGVFELLTEEEVKTVVGHELGHAVHYDMLLMTVAQLVPLVLYAIYEACLKSKKRKRKIRLRRKKDDGESIAALIGMIAYVLYVISNYIVLALSRTREYYADSYSIEITRNPNALASALVKIGYGLSTASTNAEGKKSRAASSNALGIFDSKSSKALVITSYDDGLISRDNIKQAMKWEQWNVWAKWFEFNSTHPLISKRLLAISKRSLEYNQEPFITFDLQKPESYLDDFLVEVIINFASNFFVTVASIIGYVIILLEKFDKTLGILYISIVLATITSFIKFRRKRPNKDYKTSTVRDLLGEVKVSEITAIPCTLEGEVIGRGDPGCIFNEDLTLKDDTGIIFLDYNQPLFIVNKIFALFQNSQMSGKQIKVKGWYRRSPVPYIEIKTYEVDGVEKKIFTYPLGITIYILLAILEIIAIPLFFI